MNPALMVATQQMVNAAALMVASQRLANAATLAVQGLPTIGWLASDDGLPQAAYLLTGTLRRPCSFSFADSPTGVAFATADGDPVVFEVV